MKGDCPMANNLKARASVMNSTVSYPDHISRPETVK